MIGIQCSFVIIFVNVVIVIIFKSVKVKGVGKKDKEGDEQFLNEIIFIVEDEFFEIDEKIFVFEGKFLLDKDVDLNGV